MNFLMFISLILAISVINTPRAEARPDLDMINFRQDIEIQKNNDFRTLTKVRGHLSCQCPDSNTNEKCQLNFVRLSNGSEYSVVESRKLSRRQRKTLCNRDVFLDGNISLSMLFLPDLLIAKKIHPIKYQKSHGEHSLQKSSVMEFFIERRDVDIRD